MRTVAFLGTLVIVFIALSAPPTAAAQLGISVSFGPPPLPVYEQPICPGDGYIWTPGYWAWDDDFDDYYWVPGTWVLAPEPGFLWTPPWWGWSDGVYLFHEGYWGPHVGFYGGIAYGFGYTGFGFVGGRWDHDHFFYNRSVANVNVVNVHNVYNETVNNVTVNRISFNGGPGGIEARPRPEDQLAERDRHMAAVAAQTQHIQAARSDRDLRADRNHGKPPVAATARPSDFHGHDAVKAKEAGGTYRPPANRGAGQPRNAARPGNMNRPEPGNSSPAESRNSNERPRVVHPNDLPKAERPAAPNTGNAKRDQKTQQQQETMFAKQEQERQKLQQKQEQEHQKMERQNAGAAQRQQMEQRHQQQTQQMQARHTQQQQRAQPSHSEHAPAEHRPK